MKASRLSSTRATFSSLKGKGSEPYMPTDSLVIKDLRSRFEIGSFTYPFTQHKVNAVVYLRLQPLKNTCIRKHLEFKTLH